MSKFKVGDNIVIIAQNAINGNYGLNSGMIVEINTSIGYDYRLTKNDKNLYVYENEIVLKEVFESPLFKLMEEK